MQRGGSWNNNPGNLRSANRNRNTPDNRNNNIGFRIASTACCQSVGLVSDRASGAHEACPGALRQVPFAALALAGSTSWQRARQRRIVFEQCAVASPWHVEELGKRVAALDSGEEVAIPWETAKEKLRQRAEQLGRPSWRMAARTSWHLIQLISRVNSNVDESISRPAIGNGHPGTGRSWLSGNAALPAQDFPDCRLST